MTILSFPQQGHTNSGLLDAGPYSANQWASFFSSAFIGTPEAGAIRSGVGNMFLNSIPTASPVTIRDGAGMVNGRLMQLDSDLSFAVPAPAANPRIDVMVLCHNNTGIARTVGIASGNALLFPTDLTDYDNASSIPPYTVRPVILTGTEAASPSAPTLDSDPDVLSMAPIYQYQISTGGAISNWLDLRRFDAFTPAVLMYKLDNINTGRPINQLVSIPDIYSTLRVEFDVMANSAGYVNVDLYLNNNADAVYFETYEQIVAGVQSDGVATNNRIKPSMGSAQRMSGTVKIYGVNDPNTDFTSYISECVVADTLSTAVPGIESYSVRGMFIPVANPNVTTISIRVTPSVAGAVEYAKINVWGLA